ncbi:MAG TPA: dUTP diphosphatase [Alphaproteobacteria bacterium]|jgi:dUTP pyrophosphatase|nr:dUTP diphosphatase [Alphaproteobacteria bacterium]
MSPQSLTITIHRLPHAKHLPLPQAATAQSAGMDLCAAISNPVTIMPGKWTLIGTGIAVALPPDCEAQIRPRSGLALKNGVTILNSPGTIDADYRGEVGIILINHGENPFIVEPGQRIAQMVIATYKRALWQEVEELPSTNRGTGGFGSTGVNNPKK